LFLGVEANHLRLVGAHRARLPEVLVSHFRWWVQKSVLFGHAKELFGGRGLVHHIYYYVWLLVITSREFLSTPLP